MPTFKTMSCCGLAFVLSIAVSSNILGADIPNSETLARLQVVYNTTNNGFDRYQAFALRADLDGYAGVAALFRSVARGQQILYTAAGDALKELGSVPLATADIPDVQSTKENLDRAVKDAEAFDHDNAFITYSKRAKAEGNLKVAKLFEYVHDATIENGKLLKATLKNLDQMKSAGPGYFVCGLTGFVATALDPSHCVGGDWERVK